MTDLERYDDPALARRVRAWVKETAPTTAPERLVYAVMDEVERVHPARVRRLGPVRLETVWQYVALTVVIAIGVAAGTLATRREPSGSNPPTVGSTASPSTAPSSPGTAAPPSLPSLPSLPTIQRYNLTGDPGPSALGVSGSSLWVGTPDGSILELDAATGDQVATVSVGVEPISIVPSGGLLWVGSGGNDLIWLDPASHDVGRIAGAGGPYVLPWGEFLWVSRREEFLKIDPAPRTAAGSFPAVGHAASEPALVVGDELWVGAGAKIIRIALPAGTSRGTIPVTASALVATNDSVFAINAGTLLRISTSSGPLETPVALLNGLPQPYGVKVTGDRLWVTGPFEGRTGEVVEIDLSAGRIVSRTGVGGGTRAIAVVDQSVWVAIDNGALVRLRASP